MTDPTLQDALARSLKDLRVSLTDRCNFRCTYCMPMSEFGPGFSFLPRASLLSFDEIERVARLFVRLGVTKIRLTGGEPLLRPRTEDLIARLRSIPGVQDLAMTTNGFLLTPARAAALRAAGLNRVTVSLDALDPAVFRTMNGVGAEPSRVLSAIDAAAAAGLSPVKINMVVERGVNDQEILPMAERFRGTGHILRLIEFMDVGNHNHWRMERVVSGQEMIGRIDAAYPLTALPPTSPGEVARRYAYRDGQGEIGVIQSVTAPFCGACTRARVSADGTVFTCLFASRGFPLAFHLRAGESDQAILARLGALWRQRADRYSEERQTVRADSPPKVEMFRIGG